MEQWRTAGYLRLSREDGDKGESDSIANQRKLLEQYLEGHPELSLVAFYQDDGCTGTNFDRPAFRRMERDIRRGAVNCVLVKDLSRFGRDYIEMGRYLEREFPAWGVRFIAVNDHVDSRAGRYDLMLPMKNLFNTQYARDISEKVRSAIAAKQRQGEFVGAFACYGYRKDPRDRNRLLVDPPAAQVVRYIFTLFERGTGQAGIAKLLNARGIPCPSQYKRMLGLRYHNGQKLGSTTYWTYATVHRILQNQMYAGDMEQGRSLRPTVRGRARQRPREEWVVVEGTHQAVVPREQWRRVQSLLAARRKEPDFTASPNPFAGFLRCGDCGRAMVKTGRGGQACYSCGSYKRYGPAACTRHAIPQRVLEEIVLDDLNALFSALPDKAGLARRALEEAERETGEAGALQAGLERLDRLRQSAYEDYREGLLPREEYLRYRQDYERREQQARAQLRLLQEGARRGQDPWTEELLQRGRLTRLDQITAAQALGQILVFGDGRIEITYTWAPEGEKT